MATKQEIQQKIDETNEQLLELREQYKKAEISYRVALAVKGKRLHTYLEDLQKDLGIYDRMEKARQIANEVKAKRKGVK